MIAFENQLRMSLVLIHHCTQKAPLCRQCGRRIEPGRSIAGAWFEGGGSYALQTKELYCLPVASSDRQSGRTCNAKPSEGDLLWSYFQIPMFG